MPYSASRPAPRNPLTATLLPALLLLAAGIMPALAAKPSHPQPVSPAVEAFALHDVRLLDGPFKAAQDLDARYLIALEPDRLLAGICTSAGLEPKGKPYAGWESSGLDGHSLGHYLSACAQMAAATGDERFLKRVEYVVAELARCQQAGGDGYIGAVPNGRKIFDEVAKGQFHDMAGHRLNGGWVPWYNLHKTFAGLRDAYELTGNTQALSALVYFAEWVDSVTRDLSHEQLQQMLSVEFGGMNEVLADTFGLTGTPLFLTLAERFRHDALMDPLARGEDCLPGMHANTQIPKVIGEARLYELTGASDHRKIAEFFWDRVVQHHSYANGGNSSGEHFGPPDELAARMNGEMTETCNTYNMLKLTSHLFQWQPSSKLADYQERALFNHILPSQHPRDPGAFIYRWGLYARYLQRFSGPYDAFWCCVGTGMENHALYGGMIYFHGRTTLYVNQFIPSEVTWKAQGLKLRQETNLPAEPVTRLTVSLDKPRQLTIYVRQPDWSPAMTVLLNGQPVETAANKKGYVALLRTWNDGDRVEARFAMPLRMEATADDPGRVAFLAGPILLAAPVAGAKGPVPVLLSDDPAGALARFQPTSATLTYRSAGLGRPAEITLKPITQVTTGPMVVYFDLMQEAQWAVRQEAIRRKEAARRQLDARTLDRVGVGEQQPEVEHGFADERSSAGALEGRRWRHAPDGGWFEYHLKVDPSTPLAVWAEYWGSDQGPRTFDVLIDGTKIATETLKAAHAGEFFTVEYPIAAELVQGKKEVAVRFQAHPGQTAGGLFGLRIVKPAGN